MRDYMNLEHEPGSARDRCSRCGGWISMGHARGSDCRPEGMFTKDQQVKFRAQDALYKETMETP